MSIPGKFDILSALYSLPKISIRNFFDKFDTPEMKAQREYLSQWKGPMASYIAKKCGIFDHDPTDDLYNATKPIKNPSPNPKKGFGAGKAIVLVTGLGLTTLAGIYVVSANSNNQPANQPSENPSPFPKFIIVEGSNGDCLPIDFQKQQGYSLEESDLRLRFHIQNWNKYETTVKDALGNLAIAYKEKNPNHINVHLFEGEKIPDEATFDNGQILEIFEKNKKDALGYYYDIYFLEKKGNSSLGEEVANASGAVINGNPFAYTTGVSNNDVGSNPMSWSAQHELGHKLGMPHTSSENDLINNDKTIPWFQKTEFSDPKWKEIKPYCYSQ